MFEPETINFTLEGVKGNLTITQGLLGQPKVYQDGAELKKKGFFKAKYPVVIDHGQMDMIEIKRGISFSFSVIFRGQETKLEENLSPIEYALGAVPLVFLIFSGGAIGALIGVIGLTFLYNYMRKEKKLMMQILVTAAVVGLCWLIYFIIAFLFRVAIGELVS